MEFLSKKNFPSEEFNLTAYALQSIVFSLKKLTPTQSTPPWTPPTVHQLQFQHDTRLAPSQTQIGPILFYIIKSPYPGAFSSQTAAK